MAGTLRSGDTAPAVDARPNIPWVELDGPPEVAPEALRFQGHRRGVPVSVRVPSSPELDALFRREVARMACVGHPGLPGALALGDADDRPYAVFEAVRGPRLDERLAEGRLELGETLRMAVELAGALRALHARGLAHRGLHPSRIHLVEDGARLSDWGPVAGAGPFRAPELDAGAPAGPAADVHALGAVIEAALVPPASPIDPQEAALREGLDRLVARMRVVEPARRPTAEQVHLALSELWTGWLALGRDEDEAADPTEGHRSSGVVGRAVELGVLRRHLRQAAKGQGSTVLVEGAPGSGKSALLAELARSAIAAGGVPLTLRCADSPSTPWAAVAAALEATLAELDARAEDGTLGEAMEAALRRAAPALTRLGDGLVRRLEAVGGPAADLGPERFLDTLVELLVELADHYPVVVVAIDDVELADHGTFALARRLSKRLRETRIVLVAAARSEPEHGPAVRRFASELGTAIVERLDIGPLDAAATGHLVAGLLGDAQVSKRFLANIFERSRGNPFATVELVRTLVELGLARPVWGVWRADDAALDVGALPWSASDLALRRIDALGPALRRTLDLAAVLGLRFSTEWLLAVGGEEVSQAALREAVQAGLIELGPGGCARFLQRGVREALLEALGPEARAATHRRVADVLGEQSPAALYELAHHLARAGQDAEPERIYAACFAAGRAALFALADEEACRYFEDASAAAGRAGRPPDLELVEALADAYARIGRPSRAIAAYEAAVERTPDAASRADLWARVALMRATTGAFGRGWADVERGLAELGRAPGGRLVARWDFLVGVVLERLGAGRRARPGAARQRDRVLARLHEVGTLVGHFLLDTSKTETMVLRALRAALRFGPSRELAHALMDCASIAMHYGHRAAADRYYARARAIAETIDAPAELARLVHVRATQEISDGDAREGQRLHLEALEGHGGHLEAVYFVNGCRDLTWVHLLRGDGRQAWRWVERAMERAHRAGRSARAPDAHPVYAYAIGALAMLGRVTEAQTHLRAFRSTAESSPDGRYPRAELYAHALLFHLEHGDALEVIDELELRWSRLGLAPTDTPSLLGHWWVAVAYARRSGCEGSSPSPAALEALRRAAGDLARSAARPLLAAHARLIEASLARLEGRTEDAEQRLVEAERAARAVDSLWVLSEIALERARAGRQSQPEAALRDAAHAAQLAAVGGRARRSRAIEQEFGLSRPERQSQAAQTTMSWQPSDRHLGALLRISQVSARVTDPEWQARLALDEIVALFGADRAFLLLTQPESVGLALQVGRDRQGHDIEHLAAYSRTAVDTVRRTLEPLIISGLEEGAEMGSESAVQHGLRSVMVAPLLLQERLVGVVYLDHRLTESAFTELDLQLLVAISAQLAILIETVRAARLVTYRRLAANVPGVVFQLALEPEGAVSFPFVSEGARSVLGVDPDAAVRDPRVLLSLIAEPDLEVFVRGQRASAADLGPWRWLGRMRGPGGEHWVRLEARPERQSNGTVIWDGLMIDITAQRHAEIEAGQRAAALARSNEDLEQFAYAASHDLQEPLRVVSSYLRLLEQRHGDSFDDDGRMFVHFAVDAAQRMQRMIKDLLEYARVGTRGREPAPTSLRVALDAARANLAAAIAETGAVIESGPLPDVMADPTQLAVLLQNLVGNAVKFRRPEQPPHIRVEARLLGEEVRVQVMDDGIGIAPDQASRVFGLFQRLHTREEYPGSGVGLATCQRIVARHGGALGVEPNPGGPGSCFWFTLRAAAPPGPPESAPDLRSVAPEDEAP